MRFRRLSLVSFLFGKRPSITLIRIAALILFGAIFFKTILIPTRVKTGAMEPTISKGSLIWISPFLYKINEPQPGDAVAIQLAGSSIVFISRILAGPGDRFEVNDGQIYVNRIPYPEGQFRMGELVVADRYKEITLGPSEYFIVGDNRERNMELLHSEGAFGRVYREKILGRILE